MAFAPIGLAATAVSPFVRANAVDIFALVVGIFAAWLARPAHLYTRRKGAVNNPKPPTTVSIELLHAAHTLTTLHQIEYLLLLCALNKWLQYQITSP